VYVYVGDKTNAGNAVDRAGFTNGQLYGIQVQGIPDEERTTAFLPARASLSLTSAT
jgi:hypothetical protein